MKVKGFEFSVREFAGSLGDFDARAKDNKNHLKIVDSVLSWTQFKSMRMLIGREGGTQKCLTEL
jgi:hypothetical protein